MYNFLESFQILFNLEHVGISTFYLWKIFNLCHVLTPGEWCHLCHLMFLSLLWGNIHKLCIILKAFVPQQLSAVSDIFTMNSFLCNWDNSSLAIDNISYPTEEGSVESNVVYGRSCRRCIIIIHFKFLSAALYLFNIQQYNAQLFLLSHIMHYHHNSFSCFPLSAGSS